MGFKDTITKDYMADNCVFADIFNHMIYQGESIIEPDQLHEIDTASIAVPYGKDGATVPFQKFRDEFKYLTVRGDSSSVYLLLGIENQSNIHYAMPVKNMVYDSLEYAAQVEKSLKSHRTASPAPKPQVTSGEYLTGFYRHDKLIPVITAVIYFGTDMWDAPRSLHEMLNVTDKNILSFIPDYKINLITPDELSDSQIENFNSSFREVMFYIKYSKDKKKLEEKISSDQRYQALDIKAARVINAITGSKLKYIENGGVVNMCQAIDDIRSEEHEKGLCEGRLMGHSEGRSEGLREGRLNGIQSLIFMAQKFHIPKLSVAQQIQTDFQMSLEEAHGYIEQYWGN